MGTPIPISFSFLFFFFFFNMTQICVSSLLGAMLIFSDHSNFSICAAEVSTYPNFNSKWVEGTGKERGEAASNFSS